MIEERRQRKAWRTLPSSCRRCCWCVVGRGGGGREREREREREKRWMRESEERSKCLTKDFSNLT